MTLNKGSGLVLVHLGCGPCVAPSNWIDCDGSWNAYINCIPLGINKFIRFVYGLGGVKAMRFPLHVQYVNLHKKLPFEDGSVDAIYASHVWEHLYYDDGLFAAKECFRVLKKGGYLRLVVPDTVAYCEDYLASRDADRAIVFHRHLMYRAESRERRWLKRFYTALTDFHTHKFMYDTQSLCGLVEKAGFVNMRKCDYLDSSILQIREVESVGRLGRGVGFAIESEKP